MANDLSDVAKAQISALIRSLNGSPKGKRRSKKATGEQGPQYWTIGAAVAVRRTLGLRV